MNEEELLAEQRAYYRAAADSYDRNYTEFEPLRSLLAVVDDLPISGDVLELACGTGRWTALLAARARSLTALDASAEMLARACAAAPGVRLVQADVFTWRPPRRYDTVFFAFWLSHVPPSRSPAFWTAVAGMLRPGGRAIFVDDGPPAAAWEEILTGEAAPAALRRLADGDRYRIVKVFHDDRSLTAELTALGWTVRVRPEGPFIIGVAGPPPD